MPLSENEVGLLAEQINAGRREAGNLAAAHSDSDPVKAAQAANLSRITGYPPGVIFDDVDDFVGGQKRSAARGLIESDPFLSFYATSHPLATAISADDWGSMADASKAIKKYHKEAKLGTWDWFTYNVGRGLENTMAQTAEGIGWAMGTVGLQDPFKGAVKRFAERGIVSKYDKETQEELKKSEEDLSSILVQGLTGLAATVPALAIGGIGGAAGQFGLQSAGTQVAKAREAGATREQQDQMAAYGLLSGAAFGALPFHMIMKPTQAAMPGFTGWALSKGMAVGKSAGVMAGAMEAQEALNEIVARGVYNPNAKYTLDEKRVLANAIMGGVFGVIGSRVKPYIDAGVEPPPGSSWAIDRIREIRAENDAKNLDEAVRISESTATRQAAPEIYHGLPAGHGEESVWINPDAIRKLYGDKVPAADDGILGWIPNLVNEVVMAERTGGMVEVSVADFLARIDKDTYKAIREDIVHNRDGMSLREAAELPKVPQPDFFGEPKIEVESMPSEGHPVEDTVNVIQNDLNPSGGILGWAGKIPLTQPGGFIKEVASLAGRQRGFTASEYKTVGSTTVKEAFENIAFEPYPNNILGDRLKDIIKRVIELTGDAKIHVIPDSEFLRSQGKGAAAYYYAATHNIVLPEWVANSGRAFNDILHEAVHAATVRAIRSNAKLRQQMEELTSFIRQHVPSEFQKHYSLSKWEEVMTGIIENHNSGRGHFQQVLKDIKVDRATAERLGLNPNISDMWRQIVNWIRGILGLEPQHLSALEVALRMTGQAMDVVMSPADHAYWAETEKSFGQQVAEPSPLKGKLGAEAPKPSEPKLEPPTRPKPPSAPKIDLEEMKPLVKYEPGMEPSEQLARDALGMPKTYFDKLEKLYMENEKRRQERVTARALKEAELKKKKEWEDQAVKVKEEVISDYGSMPKMKASKFFFERKFAQKDIKEQPKIMTDSLTEEERAILPKYVQRKDGLHPDDLAAEFGFGNGKEMVASLIEQVKEKESYGNITWKDFHNRQVDIEVGARMDRIFGSLPEEVFKEAQRIAYDSYIQLDILHEQTKLAAAQAGVDMPYTHEFIKSWASKAFNSTPVKKADVDMLSKGVQKIGRKIQVEWSKQNFAEVFRLSQIQEQAAWIVREAIHFEKEQDRFNRIVKQYASREKAPQDFTNFIHLIMDRVGIGPRRGRADIDTEIAAGEYKTLKDFVDAKNAEGLPEEYWLDGMEYSPTIDVAEFLYYDNPNLPSLDKMNVEQWRDVARSIISLHEFGRLEERGWTGERVEDFKTAKDMLIAGVEELSFREGGRVQKYKDTPTGEPRSWESIRHYANWIHAGLLQFEGLLNRLDRGNPNGPFHQYIILPIAKATGRQVQLTREFAKEIDGLRRFERKADGTPIDMHEVIPNDVLIDPLVNNDWSVTNRYLRITRQNLRMILLNLGNRSNQDKFMKGYKLEENWQQFIDWVNKHATKEDWDWAQATGKIFEKLQEYGDEVARDTTGIAPKRIPLEPFETNFGVYEGWYYPIVYDRSRGTGRRKISLENFGPPPKTPMGHEIERTGYVGPISLRAESLGEHVTRRIKDIAFRKLTYSLRKFFSDPDFRDAITRNMGREYTALLEPFLRDLIGMPGFRSELAGWGDRFAETIRQNIIGTYIGLNVGTVLKHGPTAAINSLFEVGPANFARAVSNLFGVHDSAGTTNWKWAIEQSSELQRRQQHWWETIGGAEDAMLRKMSLRENMLYYGSKPVALSDMLSAVPTWIAQYEKTFRDFEANRPDLSPTELHAEAVQWADRAVRRAHGSTAMLNRPEFARGGALARYLTSLYGFFSHIYQRQYELAWKIKDQWLGTETEAKLEAKDYTAMLFTYVIAPAIIEELVSSVTTPAKDQKKDYGIADLAAEVLHSSVDPKTYIKGISASVPLARDLVHGALTGHSPSTGLMASAFQEVAKVNKDLWDSRTYTDPEGSARFLEHFITLGGIATGITNHAEGRWARGIAEYVSGVEKPRELTGPWDALAKLKRMLHYGSMEPGGVRKTKLKPKSRYGIGTYPGVRQ